MKTFRRIIAEVAQPSSEDELNFKEKHVIDHILDPNSEEDQFTADEIAKFYNRADYKKGEDMAVYEGVTLTRRDLPGQEDDDVNNDGTNSMTDAQLKYRRHAQIKNKIIDEGAKFVLPEEILATEKNAFFTAAANAHKAGKTHFMFSGKKYPVTMSKDAAKTFSGKGRNLKEAQASDMSEAKMTPAQMKKREEIVMTMKRSSSDLKKKYGKDWEGVMYAIATKQAMNEQALTNDDWEKDSAKVKKSKDPKFVSKMIEKWGSRGSAWLNHPALNESIDPVGQEDDDINNDGRVDKSDAYLRARRKAIARKLQQEGLMDVIEPVGGEYGDEEKSHVAYKKKNVSNPDHRGEPVEVKEARLDEVSRDLATRAARAFSDRADKAHAKKDYTGYRKGEAARKMAVDKVTGHAKVPAVPRNVPLPKAVEDVSLADPKTGMRVYAGKTKKSQIAEAFEEGAFYFDDGSTAAIFHEEAVILNTLFESLDESNREKMMAIATSCEAGLDEIVKFAREVL